MRKKLLLAATIFLTGNIAFSAVLKDPILNKKCVDILFKNADSLKLHGDVRDDETLKSIITAKTAPEVETKIMNVCVSNATNTEYKCNITIQKNLNGNTAETDIEYRIKIAKDGLTPLVMASNDITIARGD